MQAQSDIETQVAKAINLSGPRVGFTYLGNQYTNWLNQNGSFETLFGDTLRLHPFINQFGWQFEARFFTMPDGSCGVIEFVPLIGGLDQNIALPSLTIIVGARLANGFEFGMGPVCSLSGSAVAYVVGQNFKSWGINFPVNLAVVPSRDGIRTTLTVGFNKK